MQMPDPSPSIDFKKALHNCPAVTILPAPVEDRGIDPRKNNHVTGRNKSSIFRIPTTFAPLPLKQNAFLQKHRLCPVQRNLRCRKQTGSRRTASQQDNFLTK
jgi:hypothetical protein